MTDPLVFEGSRGRCLSSKWHPLAVLCDAGDPSVSEALCASYLSDIDRRNRQQLPVCWETDPGDGYAQLPQAIAACDTEFLAEILSECALDPHGLHQCEVWLHPDTQTRLREQCPQAVEAAKRRLQQRATASIVTKGALAAGAIIGAALIVRWWEKRK